MRPVCSRRSILTRWHRSGRDSGPRMDDGLVSRRAPRCSPTTKTGSPRRSCRNRCSILPTRPGNDAGALLRPVRIFRPSPARCLKSRARPRRAQAQTFLKWVTGKGGQDILRTGDSYEYAVGVGAQSNPKLVPLADLQAPDVDPSKLNSKKVIALMMEAGLL